MIHIRVPATSANMGSGFDSIGIALNLYNHIWVEEIEEGYEIQIQKKQSIEIPSDKRNLIYKTMEQFFCRMGESLPPIRLIQEDNIPIARGLGSSAACIVEGLMAANLLSGCGLSREEIANLAAELEGHPDNTNPAVFGGMVVAAQTYEARDMKSVKLKMPDFLTFAVMVPDFSVSTSISRNVLPDTVSRRDAVFNTSRAALLVASMVEGEADNLQMAMDDRLHQPYRSKLVPGMREILSHAMAIGAKGSYLSGSGPSLAAAVKNQDAENFAAQMREYLGTLPHKWTLMMLKPDLEGVTQVFDE